MGLAVVFGRVQGLNPCLRLILLRVRCVGLSCGLVWWAFPLTMGWREFAFALVEGLVWLVMVGVFTAGSWGGWEGVWGGEEGPEGGRGVEWG